MHKDNTHTYVDRENKNVEVIAANNNNNEIIIIIIVRSVSYSILLFVE